MSNVQIAALLEEIARLRQLRGDSPFRVAAYRNAAVSVRGAKQPVAELVERDGAAGLRRLSGVGPSISRRIAEIVKLGRSRLLDRLHDQTPANLLATLPNVGPRLADRIQESLGTASLEELLRAAQDGRLRRIVGVGRKRAEAIRESLASRLGVPRPARSTTTLVDKPPVGTLLEIDRVYRHRAARGTLLRVAPRRFNPTGAAWLPILRIQRGGRRYRAHYTNSARSHELGHAHDWVAIIREDKEAFGQWTVITAPSGPLAGRRVVRGRERECQELYRRGESVQLHLANMTPEGRSSA